MAESKISGLQKVENPLPVGTGTPAPAASRRARSDDAPPPADRFSRDNPPPAADAPKTDGGLKTTPQPPPGPPVSATTRGTKASPTSVDGIRAGWEGMPGKIAVFKTPANGNRPVLVYLPPGCDPSKPFRIITMFHGHGAAVGSTFGKYGWLDRIRDVTEPGRPNAVPGADPQTIYVVPQAAAAPFTYWMAKPESMAGLERDALAQAAELAGVTTVDPDPHRIVEGHSGGGLAIANAIRSGELNADKINLLDSTYSDWGSTAVTYALDERAKGRAVQVESWYTDHEEMGDHNNAMRALARQRHDGDAVKTHNVTAETHNYVPKNHMGSK
jgi:hypothetical protein